MDYRPWTIDYGLLNMDEKRKQYIEQFGVFLEKTGSSPVAGRIIGYLITANPPQATFYELQNFLNASKSTISTSLNLLLKKKVIDYITIPGDRKRYFVINIDSWLDMLMQQALFFKGLRQFITEGVDIRKEKESDFSQGLLDICDLYQELEKEIPSAIERWKISKNKTKGRE
ncbi:MAG: GbsR/MarR family transcriptional regulator [Cytophagaceae bacterium]